MHHVRSFKIIIVVGRGGAVVDLTPGHGFESRSSRHVGTLGKSFTPVAWNSETVSVQCRERLLVVVDLKRHYRNGLNEWKNSMKQVLCIEFYKHNYTAIATMFSS